MELEFLKHNIIWFGLAVGSAGLLLWPYVKSALAGGGSSNLNPVDAVLLINRQNALVLDVRDDAEFAAGHIPDAKHIPLVQLPDRLKELAKYKSKPILVHCQGGVRSAKACDVLSKGAFTQVHNLKGGLNTWLQAKLPIVKS
ncbi:rhodanese-like domain-containing protein [Methyloradius palustris]|uniref:Rhodanese-like domain-containing protein n=1 Tax=Methyloradius palustris TaxID=2778876 RepID=A0A8D5G4H1_9PROT|nr:rhodanese-like domain-containing protein [Methyloradius palustris]BCM25808.1 rhodanese-like domain-containing protein [Methyloradius palustris]